MVYQLSIRFQKPVAALLLAIFYCNLVFSAVSFNHIKTTGNLNYPAAAFSNAAISKKLYPSSFNSLNVSPIKKPNIETNNTSQRPSKINKTNIGGPSQPEMSSFKSVGTDNLVNLFTGDFSYNIPLMDVGGYPINIFYDGGITMEQEASWVGLGWNINPGNINRNMRGVPDDFDGTDMLEQTQVMKKNRTWGMNFGGDLELVGVEKTPFAQFSGGAGASLGVSFNNYQGPALELGITGNTALSISGKAKAEKSALGLRMGGSIGITASSRNGVTFSPSVSLTATASNDYKTSQFGFGTRASTSYNSRSGIKALQLSEQVSFDAHQASIPGQDDYKISKNESIFGTTISFSKPSYIPSIRLPLTNSAWAARFEWGGGIFGAKGSAQFELYKQISEVALNDQEQKKPLVGYLYLEKAASNSNAVVDFTRFNDNEVTPKTPIISVPQYAYDVFSIQGEGTGGSIRAYRNDHGYVRDNFTSSKDKSMSLGADIAPPGHYGGSYSQIKTPTTIGEWQTGNRLRSTIGFQSASNGWENVYFRNPGETSVLDDHQYDKIGGLDLVRFKLGDDKTAPSIEPILEKFSPSGDKIGTVPGVFSNDAGTISNRKKRTQVISFLNAQEANDIGLDKEIKSYNSTAPLKSEGGKLVLDFKPIKRLNDPIQDYRKAHHISQINVTEASGQRYIYGIPVYNTLQKDFTFTIDGTTANDIDKDLVAFNQNEASKSSPDLLPGNKKDGYVQITKTPPYAHSFLLSGILSPDYVDVDNNGITENDLGSAVKFNYTQIMDAANPSQPAKSKWRTPLTDGSMANFNPGKRSDARDDRGNISYGERESWYLHSVESKSMIALFILEPRKDAKSAQGELAGINQNDNSAKRLKQIDLYNKADLKRNGLTYAKPIKTVHFEYSYKLCGQYPANNGETEQSTDDNGNPVTLTNDYGKLTLERIYFTYNGQNKKRKNLSQYVFDYGQPGTGNPNYQFNASDRWGTYKPVNTNPNDPARVFSQTMRNADHPYSYQTNYPTEDNLTTRNEKATIDQYASAWMLKKILLPSGGQMEVTYESDDYAYVQDKRAAAMMEVVGFGASSDYSQKSNHLYDKISAHVDNGEIVTSGENDYAFIKVPQPCTNADVKAKYLDKLKQICFKLVVNMPKGPEYLTSYANVNFDVASNYGVVPGNPNVIWIKMERVDNRSPLSLTAIEFLREQLPGQAFKYADVSDEAGLRQAVDLLKGVLASIGNAFTDPVNTIKDENKAKEVDLSRCFARLNDPDGFKYGGGYRVASIKVKDNWQKMTGQYTSEYGQVYTYRTNETFNGEVREISSGVASYEPSLGGEENPFHTMMQVGNTLPLGPTSYGSIEMPVLDAFFPAPVVGYSKVTVKSIKKGTDTRKTKSGIGKQVSEYYTAKDFPVYYSNTPLDPTSDLQTNSSSFEAFFWKFAFDSRAISQGFLVASNDMHGKIKSQSSYAENDEKTPINQSITYYRNTGEKGMSDKLSFVSGNDGGTIRDGNMGIDVELMTDTREFSVKSTSFEIQGQADNFPVLGWGPWIPFVWPVSGASENTYRAVTTTKVINYHSIVDRVVVIDKGSEVSTNNLLFDSETGQVIVNKTNNEFKKVIYTTTYPAYWAYSGMGLAYKNIDAIYGSLNFSDGKLLNLPEQNSIFESGDELLVLEQGSGTSTCINPSDATSILWVFDKNKTGDGLTTASHDYYFIDAKGKLFTKNNVKIKIVRSGKRNMLSASLSAVVSMQNPITNNKLVITNANNVINASTVVFKEKWQTDNEVIKKYKLVPVEAPNLVANGDFSFGNTGFGTQYVFNSSTNHPTGTYNVGSSIPSWGTSLSNCNDHTTGSGNMMMVDGSVQNSQTNFVVWTQSVNVKPNSAYNLSVWIQTINAQYTGNLANLKCLINGNPINNAGLFPKATNIPCQWTNHSGIWNSGSSTVANISIVNDGFNTNPLGNDFALDDISFREMTCEFQEVIDCAGYLEKNINPYLKGLLGIFKQYQAKVFYDARKESSPTLNTNISANGYLSNFVLYWDFDNTARLIPNVTNAKWVQQDEINRVNAKGLELETRNALNIFTAAQYGFNKTVPVAIANNSRYNDMFSESFEDYDYDEILNISDINTCMKRHVDLFNSLNSQAEIKDESILGFRAHSGKRVMSITGTYSKTFETNSSMNDDFNFLLENDYKGHMNDGGVNHSIYNPKGVAFFIPTQFNYGPSSIDATLDIDVTPATNNYEVAHVFEFWIEITTPQLYNFEVKLNEELLRNFANCTTFVNGLNATIYDLQGNQIDEHTFQQGLADAHTNATFNYSKFLCPGRYRIKGRCWQVYGATTDPQDGYNSYSWRCINCNSNNYKTSNLAYDCIFTKPIPATYSMINPVFTPLVESSTDKNMYFSAWIREDCSNCLEYTNSNIQVWSGGVNQGATTIKHTGPIIDGWQKIEGAFILPAGASQLELRFINSAASPMYVDDIRIHPYNANMKSYVYDPINLRLTAELDENNYAKFYEYDVEGTLIRTKAETKEGIKTITETRSATQKNIKAIQN